MRKRACPLAVISMQIIMEAGCLVHCYSPPITCIDDVNTTLKVADFKLKNVNLKSINFFIICPILSKFSILKIQISFIFGYFSLSIHVGRGSSSPLNITLKAFNDRIDWKITPLTSIYEQKHLKKILLKDGLTSEAKGHLFNFVHGTNSNTCRIAVI